MKKKKSTIVQWTLTKRPLNKRDSFGAEDKEPRKKEREKERERE
jgi:hypothetical protein